MTNQRTSFLQSQNKSNIQIHNKVLELYKRDAKNAIKLNNTIPIFLDTNVLLKSYSISFEAREKLYKFYNEFLERIFISGQVQSEFIKNREDIIDRFHDDVTNKLPKNFKNEIINKLNSFLEINKTVLIDYKDFEDKLKDYTAKLKKLSDSLDKLIQKKSKENNDILFNDQFLKTFSSANLLELNEDDYNFYIQEFNQLKKEIDPENLDSEFNKQGVVFPGMGDIKKKPKDPYGDYVIFHEMMEYSKANSTDIIFLTYDTSKGDWMKKNKGPHIHYLENFYLNTGQMLFILDAKRIFEETLKLNFKSLIKINPEKIDDLGSIHNLREFLEIEYPNQKKSSDNLVEELRLELIKNGYKNFDEIKSDLEKSNEAFEQYLIDRGYGKSKFSRVGNLRVRLELANGNYTLGATGAALNSIYPRYEHLLNQNYS